MDARLLPMAIVKKKEQRDCHTKTSRVGVKRALVTNYFKVIIFFVVMVIITTVEDNFAPERAPVTTSCTNGKKTVFVEFII